MKTITTFLSWAAISAVMLTNQALANTIVDTGTPNQLASDLMLSSDQWLAAKFSTNQYWELNSLEGFLKADTGNPDNATYTVALYGNAANNRPDTSNELFSQQATFTSYGWNGVYGLHLPLNMGTYWLAFEVRSTDTFQGLMPVYAPNPIQTAWNDTTSNFDYTLASGNSYNFGVRISVPLPPALILLVPGLFMVNLLSKRKVS